MPFLKSKIFWTNLLICPARAPDQTSVVDRPVPVALQDGGGVRAGKFALIKKQESVLAYLTELSANHNQYSQIMNGTKT